MAHTRPLLSIVWISYICSFNILCHVPAKPKMLWTFQKSFKHFHSAICLVWGQFMMNFSRVLVCKSWHRVSLDGPSSSETSLCWWLNSTPLFMRQILQIKKSRPSNSEVYFRWQVNSLIVRERLTSKSLSLRNWKMFI